MTNEELHQQMKDMNMSLEAILASLTGQQLLLMKVMAHQQAYLTAVRNQMAQDGEDRATLRLRLDKVYEQALGLFSAQLASLFETGDARAFLKSFAFPDEIQGN